MPSVFAELWRDAEPDMDATLGEGFRYLPRARPVANGVPDVNARAVDDTARRATYFTGRFFETAHQAPPHGRNKPLSSAHVLSGAAPLVSLSSIEALRLRGELGGDFQVGDVLWRECGGLYFRIEDVQPHDLGMVEFPLTRLASKD